MSASVQYIWSSKIDNMKLPRICHIWSIKRCMRHISGQWMDNRRFVIIKCIRCWNVIERWKVHNWFSVLNLMIGINDWQVFCIFVIANRSSWVNWCIIIRTFTMRRIFNGSLNFCLVFFQWFNCWERVLTICGWCKQSNWLLVDILMWKNCLRIRWMHWSNANVHNKN